MSLHVIAIVLTATALASTGPMNSEWHYNDVAAWPALCQRGKSQSPIDFSLKGRKGPVASDADSKFGSEPDLPPFDGTYVDDSSLQPIRLSTGCQIVDGRVGLNVLNNGHTITASLLRLDPRSQEHCTVTDPTDGTTHTLLQLHVHRRAEHLFLGHRYDMELHLVFGDRIAVESGVPAHMAERMVIAVPLKLLPESEASSAGSSTAPNRGSKFLNLMLSLGVPSKRDRNITRFPFELRNHSDTSFTLQHLLPQNDESYLAYIGSLTTPPCTEGIHWFVFENPLLISATAVKQFTKAMEHVIKDFDETGNARPVQPVGGRTIKRFVDSSASGTAATFSEEEHRLPREAGATAEGNKKGHRNDVSQELNTSRFLRLLSPTVIVIACVLAIAGLAIYGRMNASPKKRALFFASDDMSEDSTPTVLPGSPLGGATQRSGLMASVKAKFSYGATK